MHATVRKPPFCAAIVLAVSRAVFLLALVVQCIPSWGGYPPMVPILQPYQVVSPDGTWVLDVKPGNREASGPAATTLTNVKTGRIAWKRMLPYTFWQCCVNDDGVVGGFAYTKDDPYRRQCLHLIWSLIRGGLQSIVGQGITIHHRGIRLRRITIGSRSG